MFKYILVKKEKLDHKLVNFNLIENINTRESRFKLKMKVSGFLAFALLSISILSFGLTGAVNAQSVLPLSVETDSSSYTTGNSIAISGFIKTLSEFEQPVVVMIVSPDGNIVNYTTNFT